MIHLPAPELRDNELAHLCELCHQVQLVPGPSDSHPIQPLCLDRLPLAKMTASSRSAAAAKPLVSFESVTFAPRMYSTSNLACCTPRRGETRKGEVDVGALYERRCVRPRADQRQLVSVVGKGGRAVVLEEDYALNGDCDRQLLRLWHADIGPPELAVQLRVGGVEVSELAANIFELLRLAFLITEQGRRN